MREPRICMPSATEARNGPLADCALLRDDSALCFLAPGAASADYRVIAACRGSQSRIRGNNARLTRSAIAFASTSVKWTVPAVKMGEVTRRYRSRCGGVSGYAGLRATSRMIWLPIVRHFVLNSARANGQRENCRRQRTVLALRCLMRAELASEEKWRSQPRFRVLLRPVHEADLETLPDTRAGLWNVDVEAVPVSCCASRFAR